MKMAHIHTHTMKENGKKRIKVLYYKYIRACQHWFKRQCVHYYEFCLSKQKKRIFLYSVKFGIPFSLSLSMYTVYWRHSISYGLYLYVSIPQMCNVYIRSLFSLRFSFNSIHCISRETIILYGCYCHFLQQQF